MENKNICKECGGFCCKKSGCDYIPTDFNDLSTKGLLEILKTGKVSIVAALDFQKVNGKDIIVPFLYLRARNKDRDIIDLLSLKKTCSLLTDTGCSLSYEERPSLGRNLVAVEKGLCYPEKDPIKLIKEWDSYQKVLHKVVKKITGLTTEEVLRNDAKKLFTDIITENFDGVNALELKDIKQMIIPLSNVYKYEFDEVVKTKKLI